jgi:hypothetical protein
LRYFIPVFFRFLHSFYKYRQIGLPLFELNQGKFDELMPYQYINFSDLNTPCFRNAYNKNEDGGNGFHSVQGHNEMSALHHLFDQPVPFQPTNPGFDKLLRD